MLRQEEFDSKIFSKDFVDADGKKQEKMKFEFFLDQSTNLFSFQFANYRQRYFFE